MHEDTKPPNQKFFVPVGLQCVLRGWLLLQTGTQKHLPNNPGWLLRVCSPLNTPCLLLAEIPPMIFLVTLLCSSICLLLLIGDKTRPAEMSQHPSARQDTFSLGSSFKESRVCWWTLTGCGEERLQQQKYLVMTKVSRSGVRFQVQHQQ